MFSLPIAQDAAEAATIEAISSFDITNPDWWMSFLLDYGWKIIAAILILWVGSMVAGSIKRFIGRRIDNNKRIDDTLSDFMKSMVSYALTIVVWLAALSVLGVKLASVFVILSSLVLAIGLALQGSMSNVAAGLLLLLTRPYKIGDYVELAGDEGTVEDLNIFTTTLRTLDNIKVIISNGAVRGGTIRNYSSTGLRRVDVDFGIDYDDDINKAIEIIKTTAGQHNSVLTEPGAPWAKVSCLNDSSVDIQMRVWCHPDNYWEVRFDLIKSVKEAFDAGGISIPYPHCVEIEK